MFIIGTVLKVERISGTSNDGSRSWDFVQVTLWDGDAAHQAILGRDFGNAPGQGEVVCVEVNVQPRRNNRSGAYENSVTLLRQVSPEDLLDRLPATAARAAA